MNFDWNKFHALTKKYDPLAHYAVDHMYKGSTRLVNKAAGEIDNEGWVEESTDKDMKDFDRWAENGLASVAAVFGGMYGAGALGGGSAAGAGTGDGVGAGGYGAATNAALAESAVGTAGYGASSAGAGGGAGTLSGSAAGGAGWTQWLDMAGGAGGGGEEEKDPDETPEKIAERQRAEQLGLELRRRNQQFAVPGWMNMKGASK